MNFINYNGKLLPASDPVFPPNRAIYYGDGLWEGLRIHQGEILFLEDHLDRMFRGMKALKLKIPDQFTSFFFHKQILDLALAEKISSNARIRIGVYRSGGGLFEPQQNEPEYYLQAFPLNKGFEWNESSREIGIFGEVKKDFSSISFFKNMNALPYVMAAIFKKENKLDDCLLVNSQGNVADAISSNVFWIENGNFFSPPAQDGGVDGVMRKNLIQLLKKNKISFSEKSITPAELKITQEVFLTNIGWGIKPVIKFEEKAFSTETTHHLFTLLMQFILQGK